MLNKEKLVEFALLNGNIDFCGNGHGYAKNKEIYQYISDRTGVPPELFAAFHYRESGCDFNTYLHNGQKWGIYLSSDLDIVMIMFFAEAYNGVGYTKYHNTAPPHVYSGTNLHQKGKYPIDGGMTRKRPASSREYICW